MKQKTIHVCSNCGNVSAKWAGQCPECKEWNTFVEQEAPSKNKTFGHSSSTAVKYSKLKDVKSDTSAKIQCGIGEFDRVMGGGIVRDSITILTARPGGGKTTLLTMVAEGLANQGYKILFASGEESESQLKNRADRVLENIHENIWVMSDTSMDNVLSAICEIDADFIILDSIQTFTLDSYPSRAGTPVQTMECAGAIQSICKNKERPRACILIGQQNKQEELAGLMALEHLVDTVIFLDGEESGDLRACYVSKNRFGSTWERAYFKMTEKGMEEILNPSSFFITEREKGHEVSGCALTVIRDGSRCIIAELESLVSRTYTSFPTRISECIRREQLNTLISILEKRGKCNLFDKDVVLKTNGGLKLKDPSVNLAFMMSIYSSNNDIPIKGDTLFIADVGLTGELKKVPLIETRLMEADRMGYKKAYIAKNSLSRELPLKNIKIIECRTLQDVIGGVF